MRNLKLAVLACAVGTVGVGALAQMPAPLVNGSRDSTSATQLEDLLLCKPKSLFTRKSAERAFTALGLVKTPEEAYVPRPGAHVSVFGASLKAAYVSDESDQAELSASLVGVSADEVARRLGIKKQRVNGPSGPVMAYQKATGQRSHVEVLPESPRGAAVECVSY